MHSIWQEQMEFPVYPILKRDKKTDILYVGATMKHAIEANFQKEMGRSVMIIEEKKIWIPKIRQGNWSKLIGVF